MPGPEFNPPPHEAVASPAGDTEFWLVKQSQKLISPRSFEGHRDTLNSLTLNIER